MRRDSLRMISEIHSVRRAAATGVYDQATRVGRTTAHVDVLELTPSTLAPKATA